MPIRTRKEGQSTLEDGIDDDVDAMAASCPAELGA